ncbi:MAG TPA: helix-turn-helix domain-containing protein [Gemmataceae bacterium]|nr:helix-turn-helix domain-containing protein [Gemmataceae bacterium]
MKRTTEKFLTKAEAVVHGGISPSTLRRLLRAKRLKRYKKPGERRVLIALTELDAILQPQEMASL